MKFSFYWHDTSFQACDLRTPYSFLYKMYNFRTDREEALPETSTYSS